MDNNQTQINEINELIETIKEAYNPGSVTNVMVAAVLQLLNKQQQNAGNSISAINTATAARRLIFGEPATLSDILAKYNYAQAPPVVLPVMDEDATDFLAGLFLNFGLETYSRGQMLIGQFVTQRSPAPSVGYGDGFRILVREYPTDGSLDDTDVVWHMINPSDLVDVRAIEAGGDVYQAENGELYLDIKVQRELFNGLWCGLLGGSVSSSGSTYSLPGEDNISFTNALIRLIEYIKGKASGSELSNVLASDLFPLVLDSSVKSTILRQRTSGATLYPHTLASLVKTAGGGNVDEELKQAKFALFDDEWTAAGGTVIVSGVTYGCNGVDDLTYDEAVKIKSYYIGASLTDIARMYYKYGGRTLLPLRQNDLESTICFRAFMGASNLEAINIGYILAKEPWGMFQNCRSLKIINGCLSLYRCGENTNMFTNCEALEDVLISKLSTNISFADSPRLSFDSIRYMVDNAANTGTITVIVHTDVYTKLTSLAAWQELLVDALDKNITFATA